MKNIHRIKNNKIFTLTFIVVLVGALCASTLPIIHKRYSSSSYSLKNVLPSYGFNSPQKIEALEYICKQASIIPADKSWNDVFPPRATAQEVAKDILVLVKETQRAFTVRTGTQERWEVQPHHWMIDNTEKNNIYLATLGFTSSISPKKNNPDAVCILGSTRHGLIGRIEYTNGLIEKGLQTHAIILLGGERYVTKDSQDKKLDGTEEELTLIARKHNVDNWQKLTETNMFRDAYDQSDLRTKNISVYVIDTPKKDLPRPTTQTTILELLSWLKNHPDIKHIVFVSNQPYVQYQDAVITAILQEQKAKITHEVIGAAIQNSKTSQAAVEALGSYIWAVSPMILSQLNIPITDPQTKELCVELYFKNPQLYQLLSGNLK